MKACILAIGDELLIGQVINSNAAWISKYLLNYGISVIEHRSIADDPDEIRQAVDDAWQRCRLLFITGGLGPTPDDRTKDVLSAHLGYTQAFNEELYAHIKAIFEKRNIPLLEAHRQQCYLPVGAPLLENELGTAPGMLMQHEDKYLIAMPGIPYEMKNIMTRSAVPYLKNWTQSVGPRYKTIMTVGRGETTLADTLSDIIEELPEGMTISYLPSYGSVRLRVNDLRGADDDLLESVTRQISERLGHLVYGYDDISLPEALGKLLVQRQLTLAVAESCTGGMLGSMLTDAPGASDYYLGGIISYSNALKSSLLSVDPAVITAHGAVSEAVARAMLLGLLETTGADVGISITGIAGPGGGSEEKPVGTIWIAYGNSADPQTQRLFIRRSRAVNRRYACIYGLSKLRRWLVIAQ